MEDNSKRTASSYYINSVLIQSMPVIENRMIGIRSENQIVTLLAAREIFARVIDDLICANRSRRVHIPRAAHGSNFSAERFGNLDRERTHTARRAIDQNLLAWLDPPPYREDPEGQ